MIGALCFHHCDFLEGGGSEGELDLFNGSFFFQVTANFLYACETTAVDGPVNGFKSAALGVNRSRDAN